MSGWLLVTLCFQRRIALGVNPVGRLRRRMAAQAIRFVIDGCRFGGIAGVEPRPAPSVSPQLALGMALVCVANHDEPAFKRLCMADRTGGHWCRVSPIDLFHQDS